MGNTLSDVTTGLTQRGFSLDQAQGITAGVYAESGGSIVATNPTSGAYGIGQWLGARKAGLIATYGPAPTFEQQLDYLTQELRGGDPGGKYVTSQTTAAGTLQAYITKFMRPAAGKETTGDISRGTDYLANAAGYGRNALTSFLGDKTGNAIADSLAGLGSSLSAPGNAIDSATTKLVGGLDPSAWFQRIALAILAILLIGIALTMLAGKPVSAIVSKVPPVPV